jgi:hypothetical protein
MIKIDICDDINEVLKIKAEEFCLRKFDDALN